MKKEKVEKALPVQAAIVALTAAIAAVKFQSGSTVMFVVGIIMASTALATSGVIGSDAAYKVARRFRLGVAKWLRPSVIVATTRNKLVAALDAFNTTAIRMIATALGGVMVYVGFNTLHVTTPTGFLWVFAGSVAVVVSWHHKVAGWLLIATSPVARRAALGRNEFLKEWGKAVAAMFGANKR